MRSRAWSSLLAPVSWQLRDVSLGPSMPGKGDARDSSSARRHFGDLPLEVGTATIGRSPWGGDSENRPASQFTVVMRLALGFLYRSAAERCARTTGSVGGALRTGHRPGHHAAVVSCLPPQSHMSRRSEQLRPSLHRWTWFSLAVKAPGTIGATLLRREVSSRYRSHGGTHEPDVRRFRAA